MHVCVCARVQNARVHYLCGLLFKLWIRGLVGCSACSCKCSDVTIIQKHNSHAVAQ